MSALHVVHQRCIGYQRRVDGKMATVIETRWSDGQTDYDVSWEHDNGYIHSERVAFRPHIDVRQEAD